MKRKRDHRELLGRVKAIDTFKAQYGAQLSFIHGDEMLLLEKFVVGGWLRCRLHGVCGIVHESKVAFLPEHTAEHNPTCSVMELGTPCEDVRQDQEQDEDPPGTAHWVSHIYLKPNHPYANKTDIHWAG